MLLRLEQQQALLGELARLTCSSSSIGTGSSCSTTTVCTSGESKWL